MERASKLKTEYRNVDGANTRRSNIAHTYGQLQSRRPKTFDTAANVREHSGKRAIVPGLEPERDRTRNTE
jgi:hypothetical protein